MAAALLPETAPRLLTPETLRTATKQSQAIHLVPLSLCCAIKRYLRDKGKAHLNRKVPLLSASFERAKGCGAELAAAATRGALLDDTCAPTGAELRVARWKVRSAYGDIGLQYRETVPYVASRMPAIYAACHRRSKGVRFEDEIFCYVALRRGKRPEEAWPLDGMESETLKERHAKRNPEDLIIDYDEQFPSEEDEEAPVDVEDSLVPYASDAQELSLFHESGEEEQPISADLGGGWGRIIYSPIRRQVQLDVCCATKRDASEGAFERTVVTQSKNPAMHLQARRSLWGDLWPF